MCNIAAVHTAPETLAQPSPEAEAFAGTLLDTINKAGAALMISIGHRTGLIDAMASGETLDSAGWAERTGLNERYVREWLAAMATARIIDLGPDGRTYRLPQPHAFFLGRQAEGGNFASMFQFIAVLGGVESRIVERFSTGGGVPYEAFERFHEVMAEESAQTIDIDATIGLVPGLHERLQAGIDVVDVGCGLGRAIRQMASVYPASRFTGYDLGVEVVAQANEEARSAGLSNIRFIAIDATRLADEDSYDLAFTFDAVHDQPHPAEMLANIRRALRGGGAYIMQDIHAATPVAENMEHPLAPFIYTISAMHCMTVSLAQDGVGLGAAWGEQLARQMLADAGFGSVEMHKLPHDILNAYYVCRA